MSETSTLQGLTCPKCGGVLNIPEGQEIVACPYCDQRSIVSGELGLRRFQTPCKINRQQAEEAMRSFLGSSMAIGWGVKGGAQITEAFLIYMPFWMGWGKVMGWVFGEKKVGSGKHHHYEAREVRVVEDMTWNRAACDVAELGVSQVNMAGVPLQAFNPETLHREGLVFEPVGSTADARAAARSDFEARVKQRAGLDREGQTFLRVARLRLGLVYYPLWVLRYTWRGRSYQVVVDGASGVVLYGKAPGNTIYRAGVMVSGMAFGAFLGVDVGSFLLYLTADSDDGAWIGFAAIAAGAAIMFAAYQAFRFGEQYEYRAGPKEGSSFVNASVSSGLSAVVNLIEELND
ncbi:MAG TPA: hypothetical protein PKW33_02150 [Anaerolineaceae bacterium]|nr:hypothetical protein [Anaerolineaceae bacterium]HPN50362.1 hypothetical protein [Anaerolineaceae bacterium]